jgi:carbamoylphosphate synthase small subunit
MMKREARLILSYGAVFHGYSFGYEGETVGDCVPHSDIYAGDCVPHSDIYVGEVVFNTAMSGYPESLTDPSYAGQILVTTFPLIGNYGVPDTGLDCDGLPLYMESNRIHPKALVVADYSENYSHWNVKESL